MSVRVLRFSREELHDLVWGEPMSKLAPRYNLSDVGLRKICTKHRVPVPLQGYWQKVAAGKNVPPIPLPVVANEQEIVIRVLPKDDGKAGEPTIFRSALDAEAASPPVIVAERLTRPHTGTDAAREALKRTPDLYGAAHSNVTDAFLIRVHPASIPRALRLVDAIAKACEARGFELRRGQDGHHYEGQLRVVVDVFSFSLSLNERMRQEPYRATPADIAKRGRGEYVYTPAYQYAPTGEFSIKLEPTLSSGLQGVWTDGKRFTVEQRLADVMLSLRKLAIWRRIDQDRQRARQARHDEEQQRRAQLRTQIEAERTRVRQLEEDAAAWSRAEAIRAFATARGAAGDPANDPELMQWLDWASDQADRIDPMRASPPSIIDTPEAHMKPLSIGEIELD